MRTIERLGDLRGRRVLVRSDLNVPLDGDTITDDGRVRASVPTLRELAEAGARVVVMAHLGRPKGAPEPAYSLAPVARRLSELLDIDVAMATDTTGQSAREIVAGLAAGQVAVLENVRFDPRETSKDDNERGAMADELATLGDYFISDGFGVVHRKQASVYDVAERLPSAAGRLVEAEVDAFHEVLVTPQRPYTVVLGGSKVSDKLGVIDHLLEKVDRLLIGGGMAFTFLAARGFEVGGSLLERDQLDTVRGYLERAAKSGVEIVLPVDVVVAADVDENAETSVVDVSAIPNDQKGLDIGPATVDLFRGKLADAATVVWNGPMGVFELTPFSSGTREVAVAITKVDGTTVVGGGDSAAAVRALGLEESAFTHISTGGGASLELLEGKTLPGLAVLEE
ncbi:phosphoglycerate kinase [Actinobacteria bacterium YIM 96077]|uniref:Phosphoglycerate kinase n=1 Tax=Phytoactinopolyspora halophila TaxID=1981511 RepID=A0A329QMQ0_9ACTN|nr:phosphoglycerate kinase [Phytoactinopolyspora halophila]AYY12920.1 phosphoglycerate kinase [Actinobacteria bacterium YIM 96077]RAW13634.1 phosphoglycerate kinase [Phytoactinopolyspora halophila]